MHASALTLTALAAGAAAQSPSPPPPPTAAAASAQTTITALLGTASGVAASVVGADACATTLALACTDTAMCSNAPTITITQGPSIYVAAFATSLAGVTGSFSESCALSGTTAAVCHQSLSLSAPGTSTTASTVATLAAGQLNFRPLAVTANAGALAATTGSCKATATKKGGAAEGVRLGLRGGIGEVVFKVLVPVGMAVGVGMV